MSLQTKNGFNANEPVSVTKLTLSVIIITKNEEKNIARCLNSVELWADEIIVVDSGSADLTEEICKRYPQVRFSYNPWGGFGPQKKHALSLASSQWILSLDADEVIPPELAREIKTVIADSNFNGYKIQRKNFYRSQWIRHCGWWPEWKLRLFRRESGCITNSLVHESVEVKGTVGRLKHPFEHYSYNSVSDFTVKMDLFSSLGAQNMRRNGRRTSTADACFRAIWAFCRIYFLKLGFLDGRAGLIIAFSAMAGIFYRYIKLLELRQDSKKQ
ncbi:MAG: glycosyltransferase family 2 protein [Chitinispirillales bacterium]|jgi:glycosyltransferase involved in cell wall biosynthesis|nr:glycosyltransferase family 2 protein [Chitinispirillales bacterium]